MRPTFESVRAGNPPVDFRVKQGTSPVILTLPHSGFYVPDEFYLDHSPLGLPEAYFDPLNSGRRNEACDWGTKELASELEKVLPDATFLTSSVSRLVVDLNRTPEHTIPETLDELGHEIPGNLGLTDKQKCDRIKRFYDPFHAALAQEISRIRNIHGGSLMLDLHSCSPTWHGVMRNDAEIGVIFWEKNPLADAVLDLLGDQADFKIAANYPYDLINGKLAHRNAGRGISERHGVHYVAIEIRNDFLSHPESLMKINALVAKTALKLEASSNLSFLMNREQTQHAIAENDGPTGNFKPAYA